MFRPRWEQRGTDYQCWRTFALCEKSQDSRRHLSHCCCRITAQCYREVLVDCFTMSIIALHKRKCDFENRKVLSSHRNEMIDEAAWTRGGGRELQDRAAATGKAWLPIVVRHVDGTSRADVSVELSCRPEGRLDAGRMHSLRHCGTSAHTAGTGSAQGLLANVASEAVESCEQICSPRRPASLRH